jgi:hypothetical protein
MIAVCMNCWCWSERDTKKGLCIACGASGTEQRLFKSKREFYETMLKDPDINPTGKLLSTIQCNNKNGDYDDLIEKIERMSQ